MATTTAPTVSLPINLSQAQVPVQPQTQLIHYIHEVPANEAAKFQRKAILFKALSYITVVAIVAIVASVLVVSLTMGVLTGTLPFILLGLSLSTPFLAIAASKLNSLAGNFDKDVISLFSNTYADRAKVERGVANELREIREKFNWKTAEITKYFAEKNWKMDHLPMDALRLINPDEPLCALLPLIARYRFIEKLGIDLEVRSFVMRKRTYEDRSNKYNGYTQGYDMHEGEAIPCLLQAAFYAEVVQNPTIRTELGDMVVVEERNFTERQIDKDRGYKDKDTNLVDPYLKFIQPTKDPKNSIRVDSTRPAIPLSKLDETLSPPEQFDLIVLDRQHETNSQLTDEAYQEKVSAALEPYRLKLASAPETYRQILFPVPVRV